MNTTDTSTPKALPLSKVISLIPRGKRGGSVGVVIGSLALAALDFIGIAVLVPILLLILTDDISASNPTIQWFYDTLGFSSFTGFVIAVCISVVVVSILKSIFAVLISDRINKYLLSLYADYSMRMFESYTSKGLLFIRSNNTAQLINNINGVCLKFTDGVLGQIFAILTDSILLLLICTALLVYDPYLVLLAAIIFIPLTLIYTLIFRRRMNENGRMENKLFVGQNKILYETLRGYSDIEINNAESYVAGRFGNGLNRLINYRRKASTVRTASGRMAELSLIIGVSILIVIGVITGDAVSSLKMALGVFAVAAYKIVPAVSHITNCAVEYKRNSFAAEKIYETLNDNSPAKKSDNSSSRLPFDREIVFNGVSFSYTLEDKKVIDNFSLTIKRGEKIGLRGYSGAGKTTLFNLLCGFFTPSEGSITIDGVHLTDKTRRQWQNNIAYVSQDTFIPDISIAENIAFGVSREDIDSVRLQSAVEASSLTEFIESLPCGIETITGEAGCRLSGGQRQRIGIARALYKEASVLMLDEATSSLDSKTERDIVDAVEKLSAADSELTILIISHRQETLAFCDRIIEL